MTSREKASLALKVLEDHKAQATIALDLKEITLITDYFVISEGSSDVQIRALADSVLEAFAEVKCRPLGTEGYQEARWVLIDLGDVVVHIFASDERKFYALERLGPMRRAWRLLNWRARCRERAGTGRRL